ncbi:hypothetical protein [Propionivibrio sp.]|uniref:hypothetical protein n=1 Tax=Propionivibrio sp. TaxID=2212460 RepID=UPI003BF3E1F4
MFDFLERVLIDTLAEVVTLPFKPIESVLDVVVKVVDPGNQSLSDIRRESFPDSIFRGRD